MDEPVDESLLRDTLCGVELALVDLVEQQHRAEAHGRRTEAAALQPEIEGLHRQLAEIAETVAGSRLDVHGV
jgi:hypothetical protein